MSGRLVMRDQESLRRRRLTTSLRIVLAVPQQIVVAVWAVLVPAAAALAWLAALVDGRVPPWLRRFLSAFLRYQGQVTAWFHLLSDRYPDPLHTLEHPFTIEVPERARQHRLVTVFRLPLALPAIVLWSVFGVVLALVAIASWFVALALGRTTSGLQELGTFCLRYQLETLAYVLLLSASYPRLAPPELTTAPG
jgi:Domain of unknown function (DUF4389)